VSSLPLLQQHNQPQRQLLCGLQLPLRVVCHQLREPASGRIQGGPFPEQEQGDQPGGQQETSAEADGRPHRPGGAAGAVTLHEEGGGDMPVPDEQ